jgi:hypothetical protein
VTRALASEELPGSDTEHARRAARVDTRVLEAIMRRHNRALYRTARVVLRSPLPRESSSPSSSEKEKP